MNKSLVTIQYKTADGKRIRLEVSIEVKELLEQSDRQIRSQRRQDRRYLDREDFIDGLTDAAMRYPQETDAADLVMKKESYNRLREAINGLSDVQRRRLLLYFAADLTHSQIADLDKVNRATITRSIERALKQLRKSLAE